MNYITNLIPASYGQMSLVMPVFRELQDHWMPEKYIEREFDGFMKGSFSPERAIFLGKCAPSLARGFFKLFPKMPALVYSTLPEEEAGSSPDRLFLWGSHPRQSPMNVDSSRLAAEWIRATKGDAVAFVSGGASALLASPPPGWSLDEINEIEGALLAAGAPIEEINAVRMALSTLKNGGMAGLFKPFSVRPFVWCDVAPENYRMTGSAPFWTSRRSSPAEVLGRYGIASPRRLEEEAPPVLNENFEVIKLADGEMMAGDLVRRLEEKGVRAKILMIPEGTEAGKAAEEISLAARNSARPCVIAGNGEYPVKVRGTGKGGRCSHLAALMARELRGVKKWCFAAAATDGEDGNGGGGALVRDGLAIGEEALDGAIMSCSTAELFEKTGALIPRGTTRNNLRDIWFLSLEE